MLQVLWVSGAQGFVGSSLIECLRREKYIVYEIRILNMGLQVTESSSRKVYNVSWTTNRIPQILSPTHILHFGAKGVGEPKSSEFHQYNYEQSLKIAEFVMNLNLNCFYFFAGSIDEYSGLEFPDEKTDLSDLVLSPYAYWKMRTGKELLGIFLSHPRISFSHLRICNLFGRNQRSGTLLPSLLNRNLQDYTISHSEFFRDLMWVDDFSRNLVCLLKLKEIPSIINLGRGESTYWRDFVIQAWLVAGKSLENLHFKESPENIGGLLKPHMNIQLIKAVLGDGYSITSVEEALRSIVSARK